MRRYSSTNPKTDRLETKGLQNHRKHCLPYPNDRNNHVYKVTTHSIRPTSSKITAHLTNQHTPRRNLTILGLRLGERRITLRLVMRRDHHRRGHGRRSEAHRVNRLIPGLPQEGIR